MRALAYPLQFEVLSTGLALYVVLTFFHFTWRLASVNIITTVVWIVLAIGVVMASCILAVEYGMELVAASAEGSPRPPPLRPELMRVQAGERRFLRLAIWLALFAGVAQQLVRNGLLPAAYLVLLLLVLLLPAALLNNTLYQKLGTMLAPSALWITISRCGLAYVPILAGFVLTLGLGWLIVTGPAVLYLVLFPLMLYGYFLCCHLLGRCVHRNHAVFFPPVDFKADRKALQESSATFEALNRELGAAFELLRAGDRDRASKRVRELAEVGNWRRFERVFGYVAQWSDAGPAAHLCREFIDSKAGLERSALALACAVWGTRHDPAFTLHRFASVEALAAKAGTPEQFRAIFLLLDRHLPRLAGAERERALELARAIAVDQLKDESLYQRVLALRAPVPPCENPAR